MKVMSEVWGDQLRSTYGAVLPDDYLTFDWETTGTSLRTDLPIEGGHCIVRGRKVVQRGSFAIDWGKLFTGAKRRWFWGKVDRIASIMRKQCPWRLDVDYLQKHGLHPRKVLGFYGKLFRKNREAEAFFAGHNAWRFDVPLAERCFWDLDLPTFEFGPMEVLDTGGMEKASQIDRPPYPDETMEDYFKLIAARWEKGVFWAMDHCVEKYGFVKRFGINPDELHQAGTDAYCCHLLYEEHRDNGQKEEAPF